jgi:putative membrane protein
MKLLSLALIGLVALLHVVFLIIEMFLWDHPFGRKRFGMSAEQSAATRVLAANQGLYNGFLVAGLAWALLSDRLDLKLFFLGCVIVAGLYGAATAKRSILFLQALPAAAALAAVLAAG